MSKRRYVEFAKSGEKPPETPQHVKPEPPPKLEAELKSLIFGFGRMRSLEPNINFPATFRPFLPSPFLPSEGKLTGPSGPWGADLLDDAPPVEAVEKTTTLDGKISNYSLLARVGIQTIQELSSSYVDTGITESKPEPEPKKPKYKHNYQLLLRVQAIIAEDTKTDLLTNWELMVLENYAEDCDDDYDLDRRRKRMIRNVCNSCAYKDIKWEKN